MDMENAPEEDPDAAMESGGEEGEDGDGKQEYVKVDLQPFMRGPYTAQEGVQQEVEDSIIEPSRPLLQMRISRQRRDFGTEGFSLIEKEASEFTHELKS